MQAVFVFVASGMLAIALVGGLWGILEIIRILRERKD